MPHIVQFPACGTCGAYVDVRRCMVCGDFYCRDHITINEQWSEPEGDVDVYCEHVTINESANEWFAGSGPGWDSGDDEGPSLPFEGMSWVR